MGDSINVKPEIGSGWHALIAGSTARMPVKGTPDYLGKVAAWQYIIRIPRNVELSRLVLARNEYCEVQQ